MKYKSGEEPRIGDVVFNGYSEHTVRALNEDCDGDCLVGAVRYTHGDGWDFASGVDLVSRAEHTKHDSNKPDFTLVDPAVMLEIAEVFTHGAEKYSPDNWRQCTEPKRYVAAAERHINAWLRGEEADVDTGKSHLAHAVCSLVMARGIENALD